MSKEDSKRLSEYVRELGKVPLTRIEKRHELSEWKSYNIYQTGSVEDGYAPSDRKGLRVFFDRFNDLSELKGKIDDLGLSSIKEKLLGHIPVYETEWSRFGYHSHKEDKKKFFEEHYTVYPLPEEANTERIDIYQDTKNSLKWLTNVETPEELYLLFKRLREGLKKKNEYETAELPEKINLIFRKRGIGPVGYNDDELFTMIHPELKLERNVFRFLGEPFPELKYLKKLYQEDHDILNNAIKAIEILEDYILDRKGQNLYPWNRFSGDENE